jgi:hypothetical protein
LIIKDNKTWILFRAGRGGLIRENEKQMEAFYNNSVTSDSDIKLTQMDLLVNWEKRRIDIFVNRSYKDTCNFFDDNIQSVDQVLLYNLYNSTSYWRDLVICQEICYDFIWEKLFMVGGFWIFIFHLNF